MDENTTELAKRLEQIIRDRVREWEKRKAQGKVRPEENELELGMDLGTFTPIGQLPFVFN